MILLLFGPPGAGKGTQSANLIEKRGMFQISTGDLFRNAIKNKTALGVEAKSYMDKGMLVPDTLVTGMVEEALNSFFSEGSSKGLILDGYPRTIEQASDLNDILVKLNKEVSASIFINVEPSILVGRLVGRRVCKSCGSVFHMSTQRPKIDGKCDKCGGEVVQRTDDQEEVIKSRLDIYYKSANALSDYYRKKGLYREIDGLGSSSEVYERLVEQLKH